MKTIFIISSFLIIFYSCNNDYAEKEEKTSSNISLKLEVRTILTDSLGWGYQIYQNGNLYINQPHIPAIQGYTGFDNEAIAKKVGEYICWKIENGIIPPTVTPAELDSLMS